MLKFFLNLGLTIFTFLLVSCSGESYDVSKAINILPDKTDNFTPTPALKNVPVQADNAEYYFGNLEPKKLAKLSGKLSNFELSENQVCYVKSNLKLSCVSLETEKQIAEIPLFSKNSDVKKANISSLLLTVSGKNAIAVTNNGYIVKADVGEKKINWTAKLTDIITIKPFIYENKVFIFTASGASAIFDLETGEVLHSSAKTDDPVGINFDITQNLEPILISNANVLTSYYRSDLMFFDINSGLKVFSISLSESSLDFAKIKSKPVIFRTLLIVPTSENLTTILLTNGLKIWSLNADVSSNLSALGGFIFFFDNKTKNLVSVLAQNADVKWKTELEIPKNTSKVWIVPEGQKSLLVFDEKGFLTKFNLINGDELEEEKRQKFYSPDFNYTLINNKIYYTDSGNNLIILE